MRRDALDNRDRLLAAATQVFADEGIDAPVEAVAREAGVGTGTFYRHFPTKQALIDHVVGSLRTELLRLADAGLECTDGTGLEQLLYSAGQLQADQPGCVHQLWNSSTIAASVVDQFRTRCATLLAAAQDAGRIRPDVTPADVSMAFWSVGAIVETTRDEAPKAWRRHLEIVIAGMRPPGRADDETLVEAPLSAAAHRRIVGIAR